MRIWDGRGREDRDRERGRAGGYLSNDRADFRRDLIQVHALLVPVAVRRVTVVSTEPVNRLPFLQL